MTMFKVGDRVERNSQNWNLSDQDGGAGNLGTVIKVKDDPRGEIQLVDVDWDNGRKFREYYHRQLKVNNKKKDVKTEESEVSEERRRNLVIYGNMVFTDFAIICKVGGEEYKFPCHKVIIAAGSGHFARMFESGMTEVSNGEAEIQGYSKEEVEHFVKFLYIPTMDQEVLEKCAIKFLKMADQYDVTQLKVDVADFLLSKLTKDTMLDIVLAAHSYNAPELKTAAIKAIVKNKVKKESQEEWRLTLKGHEDLLLDIFMANNFE